ncbi:MAG: type II secretion system protein GspI [Robiginitomaculum sp.]|nr:MAG: type II secretion system protein GspI [Robiginitomaculum sp.]PHS40799.1 MAG: type II secretion system protein GspI [Robiginitomaculum sp.]
MNKKSGFTLIEVLASLLIFSTAILGLMHAGSENIRAMSVLEQKQLAGIVADNQLLLALNRSAPLRVGTQQDSGEMAGRDWNWRIQTQDTGNAGFFKITITVREKTSEQVLMTRFAFAANKPSVRREIQQ